MPTWGDILKELQGPALETQRQIRLGKLPANTPVVIDFDGVRRKYLRSLFEHTGRPVILYASNWTSPKPGVDPDLVSIIPEDIQGFMEVMHGVPEGSMDLILHSPGGSGEAAESLVSYIRSKFGDVRVFVPHAAMSAATMLACSGNRIGMGKHSFLGPTDPQFTIATELGRQSYPAHAIVEQFERAKEECAKNPTVLPAWLPILRQYGPALIVRCQLARELSEELVTDWLAKYMMPGEPEKAKGIAAFLANHKNFKSHNRFINRSKARDLGLVVEDLEADQKLQDAVLSVFHAASHTFNASPIVKIIENHLGKAFIKAQSQMQIMMSPGQAFPQPPPLAG
jgi:Serine dehydrogenase proteinase